MGIAIKKLTNEDIADFENFLITERADLPDLRLAPLAYPHEDIAVIAFKRNSKTHRLNMLRLSRPIITLIFSPVMLFTMTKC